MSSTADRRTDVLRAIVSDYIASHEPVGSKALVDRHSLGVSSAVSTSAAAAAASPASVERCCRLRWWRERSGCGIGTQ